MLRQMNKKCRLISTKRNYVTYQIQGLKWISTYILQYSREHLQLSLAKSKNTKAIGRSLFTIGCAAKRNWTKMLFIGTYRLTTGVAVEKATERSVLNSWNAPFCFRSGALIHFVSVILIPDFSRYLCQIKIDYLLFTLLICFFNILSWVLLFVFGRSFAVPYQSRYSSATRSFPP